MSVRGVRSSLRAARQSLLKLAFDHKKKQAVDLRGNVKFLFDQGQNLIGDMLVSTIAFRAIKDKYPHWRIHVIAGPDNREVIRENECVDKVHLMSGAVSGALALRAEKFDVFYFHQNRLRLRDFVLLRYAGARINIGRAKEAYRLFDHSLEDPGGTERDRYLSFLDFFAIDGRQYGYEFPLDREEQARAQTFLSECPGQSTIVFNAFGSPHGKRFNRSTSCSLIAEINLACPDARIILVSPPALRVEAGEIKRQLGFSNVYLAAYIETIRDSTALISLSDAVVTPDTSIVHIACAYDKPQICVYRDRIELSLWQPYSDKALCLLPRAPSRDVNDVDMREFRHSLGTLWGLVRNGKGIS